MIGWIKGFFKGFVEELCVKSKFGNQLGVDTLYRWVASTCFFALGYFLIFNFDTWMIEYDKWTHTTFGWQLSDVPSPSKIAWHRLTGGLMCGAGIFVVTLHYLISLYRRIKARIAASKAKKSGHTTNTQEQKNDELD